MVMSSCVKFPVSAVALFLCLVMHLGCARRESSGALLPETAGRPASGQAAAEGQRRRDTPAAAAQQDLRVYTNPDDPLFGLPSSENLPLDFTLGPLFNEAVPDASGREVFSLIHDFFTALNAGHSAEEYLHPDYRSFLTRSLDNAIQPFDQWQPHESAETDEDQETEEESNRLKSALGSFRVGEIRFSGDGLAAQTEVLLINSLSRLKGRARGGVIAEKKESHWYITGLTLDFDELFLPPAEKAGEIFDPGPSTDPF